MLEAMWSGLLHTLNPQVMGIMMLGVPVGLLLGAIPGLGGNLGLALLIPFTFGMDPYAGFALLLGMHSVVQTGGPIPSILFNAPGTGPCAATCLDGYPLAQKGQAGRAIGAALVASAVGGVVGALGMALLVPVMREVVLAFSPAEFFMLAVLGITFISLVSGESMLKGLIVGALGLMLSFVGSDTQTGVMRYTFGQLALFDGVSIVPVVVGLFAGSEAIALMVKRGTIVEGSGVTVGNDVMVGVKDVFRYWWLTLRCSIIGYIIGVIPGLGGEVSSWVSYGHAAQSSKDPKSFGHGNIEGVIAPESANNSKEGGALIPTVAFGVPGSSGMAILLGAFLILGLQPGPAMLKEHLDVVWAMVWILVIANIIGALAFLVLTPYFSKLTQLRTSMIVPFILVFIMVGSYLTEGRFENFVITLVMSLVGYGMKKFDYPRAPLILGLVLGEIAETNLHISLRLWGPAFLTRPITMVLLAITLASVFYPVWQAWSKRRQLVRATA
jgi:putative tricarboxylic transport membrane protein